MPSKESGYVLPNMSFAFKIQVKGQESELLWTGNFKYHRPTLGERSRIDVMRVRLSGDLETLDSEVADFNEMVSHLRFTLDEYPDWWKETSFGMELYDGNVISEIYKKVMEFEAGFRKKVYAKTQDGVSEDASAVEPGSPSELVKDVAGAGEASAQL